MNQASLPPLTVKIAVGTPPDRLLSSNLAALSACDLDLAKAVALARPDPLAQPVVVYPAESGVPTVIAGSLQVHSPIDPLAEAEIQALRVPPGAGRVLLLGFGAGHLISVLLARPQVQRLDVVPLNLWVLREVIRTLDIKPLLCDPRLRIAYDERVLSEPFAAVTPLLQLAEQRRHALCEQALRALGGPPAPVAAPPAPAAMAGGTRPPRERDLGARGAGR